MIIYSFDFFHQHNLFYLRKCILHFKRDVKSPPRIYIYIYIYIFGVQEYVFGMHKDFQALCLPIVHLLNASHHNFQFSHS